MISRVAAAIQDCCDAAQGKLPVMITHSGVIRATLLLAGQPNTGQRPANAQPIHFEWTGTGHQETVHDV